MDKFCKVCGHPTSVIAGDYCVACGQDPHQSFEEDVELDAEFIDAIIAEINKVHGGVK